MTTQPQPLVDIRVYPDPAAHQVRVQLGQQTLALSPEAAAALADALAQHASQLAPGLARPQGAAGAAQDTTATAVVNAIALLVERFQRGHLDPPTKSKPPELTAAAKLLNAPGPATLSAPEG